MLYDKKMPSLKEKILAKKEADEAIAALAEEKVRPKANAKIASLKEKVKKVGQVKKVKKIK